MPISPLDFILLQFGSPGYYQVFLGFLLCCLQLPIVFTEYLFRHYSYEPPHRCQLSAHHLRQFDNWRREVSLHKNEWYPVLIKRTGLPGTTPTFDQLLLWGGPSIPSSNFSSSHVQFDQCNIYLDPVHHWKGTQSCPNGWEFWTPQHQHTLITEFALVCENKSQLVALKLSLTVAALVGAVLFGFLADRWGRSRMLNFTLYLFVASSLSAYFAFDFLQFSAFYTLQVFFINGLQIISFVLLLEILPTPFQLQATLLWFICRTVTALLVPLLVSAVTDWRYMQLSIAVPSFAFFTYIFVIPSSPLWLTVVRHNLPAAVRTLSHFGKFNGKILSTQQLNQHLQNLYTSTLSLVCQVPGDGIMLPHHQHQPIYLEARLSKPGPILRWFLLTHFYLFYVVTVLNSELVDKHALILNQNQQLNALYNGLLDLGIIILSYHLAVWLGGRAVQALLFILTGALIVTSLVLKEYLRVRSVDLADATFDQRLLLLPPMLIALARSASRTIVAFVWFHAAKTIPTNVRATGLGCCLFWAGLGKISVPHLLVLSSHLPYNLLLGLFGVLALISAALTLMFPRLHNKPLPNTLVDLEERSMSCRSGSATSTLTSKRYPSYQDLKAYSKSRSASVYNVYAVSPGNNHQMPNATMTLMRTVPKIAHLNEVMTLSRAQQHSMSSGKSAETDKSSLSISSRHNSLHKTTMEPSLLEISPSTSFTVSQSLQRPSYVSYQNGTLDQDFNFFSASELNNEFTVEAIDASLDRAAHHYQPTPNDTMTNSASEHLYQDNGAFDGDNSGMTLYKTVQV